MQNALPRIFKLTESKIVSQCLTGVNLLSKALKFNTLQLSIIQTQHRCQRFGSVQTLI